MSDPQLPSPQQPPYGQQPQYFPPQQQGGFYSQQPGGPQLGGPSGPYPWQQLAGQTPMPPRKSHRTRNIVLGIVGALVLIIVIAAVAIAGKTPGSNTGLGNISNASSPAAAAPPAPAATTQPPSGPVSLAVGQAATIDQNNDPSQSATVTITSVTHNTQPGDPSFGSPPQNGYYVIANVTAASQTDGFDINSLDFYVLVNGQHFDEGDGNAYDAVSGTPVDITTTLNSGESATGQLLFDVPSAHGQIVYAPNLDGAPLATWSF